MDRATGSSENMYLQKYKVGPKVIGHGQFGKVKVAEHALTGHKVAIKILNRRMIKEKNIEERESKILRLLMHPHIVRLYEVIETPTDIFLVMEYVQSGDLFDYIAEKGKLREDEARRLFQQIISGVECCHRNMVVHRDLKPENLLLDSGYNVKIADFGLSNIMRDGHFLKTSCGSLHYAAPEVISGELYAGPAVDVWSCGVILYAILCGTLPFDDGNTSILHRKIQGGIYTLPSHLSVSARDLIRRMIVVDPVKRISIPDIRQHPWFQAHLLPHYLAVPPPVAKMMQIDEEILRKVVSLGFHRNILVDSLHKGLQNEGTVAYYLLLDNRFGSSTGAEFPGSIVGAPVGAHFPANTEYQGMGSQPKLPVERKWALGLQSGAQPHEIMTEVLKALEELNISWKKIGHFVMKCRWVWVPRVPPGRYVATISTTMQQNSFFGDELTIAKNDSVSDPTNVVKFELQLFKTREERKYLLDLQRVQGPQFLFLDLCASFLAQLGVF